MHSHGTKFRRQRWLRGIDRHQSWGCAFDGQPTTALPIMPLLCDMGLSLLTMQENSNFWKDRCTLMEQSLQIEVMARNWCHQSWWCAFDGQPTTALSSIPLLCDMGLSLLIMQQNSNFWTDLCTLMKQSIANISDGEELIDTKVGGVRSTDKDLRPSQLCLYWVIWALACWLCGKILTSEWIDAESRNRV